MAYVKTHGIFYAGLCVKSDGVWEQFAKVPHARAVPEPDFKREEPQLHARRRVAHVALEIQPWI